MKRQASATLQVVRAGRTKSRGGRVRFSASAREAATAHALARQDEGIALAVAAREAGVGYQTLRRWLRAEAQAFRPVSVVAAAPTRDLAVLLPGGLRVEGLGFDEVIELLRRLR